MKLFLSWSGERSKEFAKAARIWMETIFDEEIEYFMSDDDVQPGQRWVRELSNSLDETDLGILLAEMNAGSKKEKSWVAWYSTIQKGLWPPSYLKSSHCSGIPEVGKFSLLIYHKMNGYTKPHCRKP